MNLLTKQDLRKDALVLLKAHKKDKIFATQDGQYFLQKQDAIVHNNGIKTETRGEWEGEVITFTELDEAAEKSLAKSKSEDEKKLAAAIKSAEGAGKSLAKAIETRDGIAKGLEKSPGDEKLTKKLEDANAKVLEAEKAVADAAHIVNELQSK